MYFKYEELKCLHSPYTYFRPNNLPKYIVFGSLFHPIHILELPSQTFTWYKQKFVVFFIINISKH